MTAEEYYENLKKSLTEEVCSGSDFPESAVDEVLKPYITDTFNDAYELGQEDFQRGLTKLPPETYLELSNKINELKSENEKNQALFKEIRNLVWSDAADGVVLAKIMEMLN